MRKPSSLFSSFSGLSRPLHRAMRKRIAGGEEEKKQKRSCWKGERTGTMRQAGWKAVLEEE
jgi:hypothetical protein